MNVSKVCVGVASLSLLALGMAASPLKASHMSMVENQEPSAAALAWVDANLASAVRELADLKKDLDSANKERASWKDFSEDFKGWTKDQAEQNKATYAYAEYLWSVAKDKDFRAKHTGAPSVAALKALQDKSGGVISEFFVTDAKGGNVAQTQLTSDWFQGDEPKFSDCAKAMKTVAGKPSRDQTTGVTGVHVSIPITGADGKLSGVAIVLVVVDKIK